ncbi:hypothetical protein EBME_0397 [bacterium endosymbiont of Mortierella elongata FMR23-6]|nr:hypothetical protein EBME_0397 [bacterium endosymbiont of Mortierella elongata FMR23-6]
MTRIRRVGIVAFNQAKARILAKPGCTERYLGRSVKEFALSALN